MLGTAPPYALDTVVFPFPALALCAGRAPLGGDRELALGVFMAARLAHAMLPPMELGQSERTQRADRAKHWVNGLAMPQPARLALLRAFDATMNTPSVAADALAELAQIVTGHLEDAAQHEVAQLIARLQTNPAAEPPAPGTPGIYYPNTP